MKPQTIAIVMLRVFGVITILAGPMTFLRVPALSKAYVRPPVSRSPSSAESGTLTDQGAMESLRVPRDVAVSSAMWSSILSVIISGVAQVVTGLVLILASRPLARLVCRGVSDTS